MSLSITLKQHQKLSPTTIQLISILQMNTVELQSYIESEIQENPMFELEELPVHDVGFYAPRRNALKDNTLSLENYSRAEREMPRSLYQDICIQLETLKGRKQYIPTAKLLAGLLDDRGYLSDEDFETVCNFNGKENAEEALKILQRLSPAGIGARSLSECLLIQLIRMPQNTDLEIEIAKSHLELMSKGHYSRISKLTGASLSKVQKACAVIRTLDPKPGNMYAQNNQINYVIPDIYLDESGKLSLNIRHVPKLNYNNYYLELLKDSYDQELSEYLQKKLQQAEQLIGNLHRRGTTILRCAEAIVQYQSPFFDSQGKHSLLPMTQAQLAELTELSESTVSRTINGKYIQCPFGIFPLNHFFSTALNIGEQNISNTDVKERIRLLIDTEDKFSPLSDQDIADQLSADGIAVSRRTVAKYRHQLNIPGTYIRKQ